VLLMRALAAALLALSLACAAATPESAPLQPATGEISWEQALALIRSGEVRSVMQTHALEVALGTASGARYTTREPEIDAVLRAVRELAPNAGEIAVATE
jgi:hypothetical protein